MARKQPVDQQLALPMPEPRGSWGGRREGAGSKSTGKAKGLPHRARPWHDANHPVHVTLRVNKRLGSLRRYRVAAEIVQAFRDAATGDGAAAERRRTFRVVHFSIQPDHLHLIVEASSKVSLGRGMKGLVSRLARRINRKLRRRGRVFSDRYHGRALPTPAEVRNAVVYVITNAAKHAEPIADPGTVPVGGVDPCSSAFWFDGWAKPPPPPGLPSPVTPASTWLLRTGWKRHGLVHRHERPSARPS